MADDLGIERRSGFSPAAWHCFRFQTALVIICSSQFGNKSISSETVGAHFIYSGDQTLDPSIHRSPGQRLDVSLLNWSLPLKWMTRGLSESKLSSLGSPSKVKIGNIRFCFLEVHEKWLSENPRSVWIHVSFYFFLVGQRCHYLTSRTCMMYYCHPKCETNYVLISTPHLSFPLSKIIEQV